MKPVSEKSSQALRSGEPAALSSARDQRGAILCTASSLPLRPQLLGDQGCLARVAFHRAPLGLGRRTLAVGLFSVFCGSRPSPNSTDAAPAGSTCSPSTPPATQFAEPQVFPHSPQRDRGPGTPFSATRHATEVELGTGSPGLKMKALWRRKADPLNKEAAT